MDRGMFEASDLASRDGANKPVHVTVRDLSFVIPAGGSLFEAWSLYRDACIRQRHSERVKKLRAADAASENNSPGGASSGRADKC